ncbi:MULTISPECIES: VanZ family protein [Pontibacillus]|uniref:VanZ family protein n=1 Tax=Pontibacillus chungwhensis TaxID=265426 RepID=A0ABY8UWG6_9BACI|nr:VanZ family protein [Pontibacillus chungwhensis]MCD5325933.1 VanZ family protein [Pontibacillus sp. HN14]WIF97643.1 VanZ family protein [Pontibacillus chungwhensis]
MRFWLLPILWMGVIFYSSSTPYEEQDIKPFMSDVLDLSFLAPVLDWIQFAYHHSEVSVEALGVNGLIEFFIRKGAHVTVFLLLCMFFYVALLRSTSLKWGRSMLLSILFTFLYAVIDEVHQGFTPNRTPYVGDVMLDTAGALIACVILWLRIRMKRQA